MPKFQNIMQHLHPKVIIEKCDLPHDTARGKYVLQSSIVRNHMEFENTIIDYVRFHMNELYGFSPPPDQALFRARQFIDSSLGFDNAVFIGLSGTEGGMPNILNQICEGFKKEAKSAYYTYIIDTYIDFLNFAEIVEVMREFKAGLGGYSPLSTTYIEPEAMAGHYKEILWSYIEGLTKYKNLWTY